MIKYINGKVYNTAKARIIGSCAGQALYRKRTGEYFSGTSDKIYPLTVSEAAAWAKKRLTADEYDAAFGEIVESESLTHVSYNIKTGNAERIRRAMSETGKSGGAIIDELIERYLG